MASNIDNPSFNRAICNYHDFLQSDQLAKYEGFASNKIRIFGFVFNGYPESSSTQKQQEHGVSEPTVQLIVTRHGQSQQI